MNKSIRKNLFYMLVFFMVSFVVCGIIFNIFFLEKYYIYKNRDVFDATASNIEVIIKESNLQEQLLEIDRSQGISVVITDESFKVIISSSGQVKNNNLQIPKEIKDLISNYNKSIKDDPIYRTTEKRADKPKLTYIAQTVDGKYIILTKSINIIRESVAVANEFYIMVGLIVLVISSIFIFYFSKKFTEPIIEISNITEDISNLDFSKKVAVVSEDELGVLANSINTLSDKLEASIDSLKNDIEFQKTLSRNMSHELKTPIGVIKGYAEGLTYGVADNEEMREKYLNVIVNECDRMDSLVKEMLTLSKLSVANYSINNKRRFSAIAMLSIFKERFETIIKENGVNIIWGIEDAEIYGEYNLIISAISNLISNALKYGDKNVIALKVEDSINYTNITVFNTGENIPNEELSKIFDVFYKVDKVRSREEGGHGLGLSIVQTIVKLHGGEIEVRNKENGVEFIIKIPKEDFI